MGVLFFKAIPRPAIWGHTKVRDFFGYDDFPEGIGQSWSFSAQDGEGLSTVCINGEFKGKTLKELWEKHQELFGHPGEDFPVIISLVGPEDDLSIQVHPDDEHAQKIGYKRGKNEAWFFIESDPGASIVYGQKTKNKEELQEMINQDKWDDIYKKYPVADGNFVYLPAGCLHAMGKGNVVYEIQQSTDVTYRFYDYHRKDKDGNERELHLKQATDCLSFDKDIDKNDVHPVVKVHENVKETIFISNDSFTVSQLLVIGKCQYKCDNYQLATVVKGSGKVDEYDVKVGDNFLIPTNTSIELDVQMMIMMTTK